VVDLCTLADVKLRIWPGEATATTDYDTELNEMIAQTTDDIQQYTGRQFIIDTIDTDYYFDIRSPGRLTSIRVPRGIASVTTLSYATVTQPGTGGTFTAIPAASRDLRPLAQDRIGGFPADEILLLPNTGLYFYYGNNTVKLTGKLGWPAVPATINKIAINLVVATFNARGGSQDQVGTGELGGSLMPFITWRDKTRLDDYRAPRVG
jgi:hypothetical protein